MRVPQCRRDFLKVVGGAMTFAAAAGGAESKPEGAPKAEPKLPIKKAVKYGMVGVDGSILAKFRVLKDLGFDGVELDSPSAIDLDEAVRASRETGLPIHGVVDSVHWRLRLSDPDPQVRAKGFEGLLTAIRDAKGYGGSSVLLVPGKVSNPETENQEQVWDRSVGLIRQALPLAAELGIHILIENVWNGFCYAHDGPANQTADKLAAYIDALNSPWVGSYFDIGNHRKYGDPAGWIRTLGRRVVKLDVKDWRRSGTPEFCRIGEGDVDWPEVRAALREIGYTGWATAEVTGGGVERLEDIAARMDRALNL